MAIMCNLRLLSDKCNVVGMDIIGKYAQKLSLNLRIKL
jgi:hypothetical protein